MLHSTPQPLLRLSSVTSSTRLMAHCRCPFSCRSEVLFLTRTVVPSFLVHRVSTRAAGSSPVSICFLTARLCCRSSGWVIESQSRESSSVLLYPVIRQNASFTSMNRPSGLATVTPISASGRTGPSDCLAIIRSAGPLLSSRTVGLVSELERHTPLLRLS
jgi:hypothetical protein